MEKMWVNGPVRQKEIGSIEQEKAEKQRRKWIGNRNLQLAYNFLVSTVNISNFKTPFHKD